MDYTYHTDKHQRRVFDVEHVLVYPGKPPMRVPDALLNLGEKGHAELIARTEDHMVYVVDVGPVHEMDMFVFHRLGGRSLFRFPCGKFRGAQHLGRRECEGEGGGIWVCGRGGRG